MFSDEVCRSVLGGKPSHHEEISVFSAAADVPCRHDRHCSRRPLSMRAPRSPPSLGSSDSVNEEIAMRRPWILVVSHGVV